MKKNVVFTLCIILFASLLMPFTAKAQSSIPRDTILLAARELMNESAYCALITVDSTGQPQIRTMNPFPQTGEFTVWFATSRSSRKVKEIRNNPKVCVYWSDHVHSNGYVNLTGTAEVIDDKDLLIKKKRDYWKNIPDWEQNFVLIKITPGTISVVNYKHNLINDPVTFGAPVAIF